MVLPLILLVLGVVIGGASIWWLTTLGATFLAILAGLGIGAGGALIVAAWGITADRISPTSRKL